MSTLFAVDAVDCRIQNYEEKWKTEYKVAELCSKFEVSLVGFVELFHVCCDINQRWRDDIFSGAIPYCANFDARIKGLFHRWLASEPLVEELLAFFEGQNYDCGLDEAHAYRESVGWAKSILANWAPPHLSVAIGHHQVTLSGEQAAEFRKRLVG